MLWLYATLLFFFFNSAHSNFKFMKKCQAAGFSRVHFLKGIFKNEIYLVSCLNNNFLYIMNHHDMCLENVFCVLCWRQIRVESKPWVSAKCKETITWERWVLLNRLVFSFIGWMPRTSSRPHNIKIQKNMFTGNLKFLSTKKNNASSKGLGLKWGFTEDNYTNPKASFLFVKRISTNDVLKQVTQL